MRGNLLVGAVVATLCWSLSAVSAAPDIYPLDKIRRGQKGYGMTTMKGTKPERFEFEVIGVNRNFLPKMDIILVKSDDPKLAVTGFWKGMSGSPLYIEGKLACAFSYGFRFNKVAIGGCTPLHYMKREGFKPRRQTGAAVASKSGLARAPITGASAREWRRLTPKNDVNEAMASLGKPRAPWLFQAPMPPAPKRARAEPDEHSMVAASVPLAMSGFSNPAFEQAKKLLSDFPVQPMQAGGTGDPNSGPSRFKMGGSISVQLMRGDMSIAGTGTVSYIDRNRVLAFGHPMFQTGESYAPVATAEVHTVIPSAFNAFVVASPMREIGSLVQDRQSTIMADTKLRTQMIPMRITINAGKNGSRQSGTFDVELLNNRFFTAALASMAASSAVSHYLPDRDHVTAKLTSTVSVKGYGDLSFTDYLYSRSGAGAVIGGARGLRVLVPLLLNPYAPVEIDEIKLKVDLSFDTNYAEIDAIRLPTSKLVPGEKNYVDVMLRGYDNVETTERIHFDVPKNLAGALVRVAVTPGDSAKIDAAPPQSLGDLFNTFKKLLPGNVFAVTIFTASEGVAMNGKLVRDLPASAADKLKTTTRTGLASTYRAMSQSIKRSSRVINGGKSLVVKVRDLD